MIIDIHGHYTTAPKELEAYRQKQIADLKEPAHARSKGTLSISDDQIRESIEKAQLKLQRERGTDVTIFSPRAAGMGHHSEFVLGADNYLKCRSWRSIDISTPRRSFCNRSNCWGCSARSPTPWIRAAVIRASNV